MPPNALSLYNMQAPPIFCLSCPDSQDYARPRYADATGGIRSSDRTNTLKNKASKQRA